MEKKTMALEKQQAQMQLTLGTSREWLKTIAQTQSDTPQQRQAGLMALAKKQAALTMEQAIGGTQVSQLKRLDEDTVTMAICALIANLCESLNLTKPMSTLQAYEAACLLLSKYWHMKLEEFIYVFKEGKMGAYGQLYNRMDVQILCEWCDTHLKSERLIAHREKANSAYKTAEREPVSPENAEKLSQIYRAIAKPVTRQEPTVQSPTYDVWLAGFKEQAEQMTIADLRKWHEVGKIQGQKDIMEITETILAEYEAGIRTYPNMAS